MTAPATPLEKAVEALRDDLKYVNADHVEHDAGSDAADVIRSAEALLAALDADRKPCEPGVICPTCVRLDGAEKALRFYANSEIYEETQMRHGFIPACGPPIVIEDGGEVARRYFARREKKGEPNAK